MKIDTLIFTFSIGKVDFCSVENFLKDMLVKSEFAVERKKDVSRTWKQVLKRADEGNLNRSFVLKFLNDIDVDSLQGKVALHNILLISLEQNVLTIHDLKQLQVLDSFVSNHPICSRSREMKENVGEKIVRYANQLGFACSLLSFFVPELPQEIISLQNNFS